MPRYIGTCFRFYTQMRVEKKTFAYRIYSHFTQQGMSHLFQFSSDPVMNISIVLILGCRGQKKVQRNQIHYKNSSQKFVTKIHHKKSQNSKKICHKNSLQKFVTKTCHIKLQGK